MIESEILKPLTPDSLSPALNPILVTDGVGLDKVEAYFKRLAEQNKHPEFAIDYETNYTNNFYDRRARVLALGDKNEQYVIDFLPFAGSTEKLIAGQGNFVTSPWARPIVNVLRPAFDSKAFLKVGQRLGFEYQVSWFNFGMRLWHLYTCDYAERLLWAGLHSLKDVNFFSLAGQAARHFKVSVDKTEQKQYDLETPLTESQIIYSCLDLRVPLAIRAMQLPKLRADQLERINAIEQNAIGYYEDIHINGWNTNRPAWRGLIDEWQTGKTDALKRLDTELIPVVGRKDITIEDATPLMDEWKDLTVDSEAEKTLKALIKETKVREDKADLRAQLELLTAARKEKSNAARKRYMEFSKKLTAARKSMDTYDGEAAINYGSGPQLLKALHQIKGINTHNLPTTDDGVLEKLKHKPVIAALRDYRTYAKLLETYGPQWITEYTDKPSAEEGWVNPRTGRIHSTINQLEAETGRTSSVKPNIQNLPHDERVRSCFIADDPNSDVLVCKHCDELPVREEFEYEGGGYLGWYCPKCEKELDASQDLKPEEYVIITCDMSGAELRIIAEESGSKQWTEALKNGWDLHSCGTETLYPDEWPAADQSGETIIKDGKEIVLPPCAYYNKVYVPQLGREEDHQKCKCPKHLKLRDENKATNFLLAYGGGPEALGDAIGKSEDDASVLMKKHEAANPEVWAYLQQSGEQAKKDMESRSRCGRLRRFKRPTRPDAREKAKERMFESLKKKNKLTLGDGTKLKLEDMFPENWQINSALKGMYGSIERRGKNFKIQSLNKSIAALAFGAGFDPEGTPYLWHYLPEIQGKIKNFVHDENVMQTPKRFAKRGLEIVQDCIKRAGAEFLTQVEMESEGRIEPFWKK